MRLHKAIPFSNADCSAVVSMQNAPSSYMVAILCCCTRLSLWDLKSEDQIYTHTFLFKCIGNEIERREARNKTETNNKNFRISLTSVFKNLEDYRESIYLFKKGEKSHARLHPRSSTLTGIRRKRISNRIQSQRDRIISLERKENLEN